MTTSNPTRITYLTAGAAGMYCGSCMHDNTLARAMTALGADVQLVPMYTPIQTDETNVAIDQVFFGGINVYLQQKYGLFRYLPRIVDRILDSPKLLRWVGSRGIETSPRQLGDLAVSMLQGSSGSQRKEVERLCRYSEQPPHAQLIVLTNALVSGSVPELKARLNAPIAVILQGDDVFLDELPASHKARALKEIRRLSGDVDAFLVHSQYYGDHMSQYLSIPRDKFRLIPLGIDTDDFGAAPTSTAHRSSDDKLRVGYLARLAPEKGLHLLVDAFLALKQQSGMDKAELTVAGWLGQQHKAFVQEQFSKLDRAGLGDHYRYLGVLNREEKIDFLRQLDLLSVPTTYREPKGLYVLEALAAGTPVVQPSHGSFPEILAATGGGHLVPPHDSAALAAAWHHLLVNEPIRRELAESGHRAVHQRFNARSTAQKTLDILQSLIR